MTTIAVGPRVAPVRGVVRPRSSDSFSHAHAQGTAAGGAAGGAATPGQVRLTRRGRVAVTVLFLALMFAAFVMFGARTAATPEPGVPVQTTAVVVGPGDTIWQIAAQHSTGGDLRDVVRQIEELNGLSDASIVAGQKLYVPVNG